jgi:hypothetical protein
MDPAELLTLVAITYRGCEYNLSNEHSRKIVGDEVARCLGAFDKTRGKWKLAWGPGGYRPGPLGPDISSMYAAAGIDKPSNLAIVIRGTNFFSLLDWMSNLPLEPRQWEYGGAGPEVQISLSTWLGLRLLQRLQAAPITSPDPPQTPFEIIQAEAAKAESAVIYALMKKIFENPAQVDIPAVMRNLTHHVTAMANAAPTPAHNYALQHAIADAQQTPPVSNTLLEFLKDFIGKAAAPVDIYVTGHSKSGALAPAFVLWLADTALQWDPADKAKIHACTFAGPTPGNAGFANRYQAARKITERMRIENPYDVVPHVWDPIEMRTIPGLYGNQLTWSSLMVNSLANAVAQYHHQHEITAPPWTGADVPQANFLQRIAVEHLDGYLKTFGIYDAESLNTLKLFAPI